MKLALFREVSEACRNVFLRGDATLQVLFQQHLPSSWLDGLAASVVADPDGYSAGANVLTSRHVHVFCICSVCLLSSQPSFLAMSGELAAGSPRLERLLL
jgi:hypothetical protein